MLHKLRGAMVSRQSASSKREVEIDEFFLGGYEEGLTGGRQREKKTLGGVAIVELGFDRSYVTFVRQLRLLGLRPRWEACRSGGHGVTVELAHEPSEEISSIGWSFARRRGAGRRTCSSAR
jgi:hypothetical protein